MDFTTPPNEGRVIKPWAKWLSRVFALLALALIVIGTIWKLSLWDQLIMLVFVSLSGYFAYISWKKPIRPTKDEVDEGKF